MSRHSTETSGTLIGLMRESNWTMRSIASVVILTFGGLVTSPAVAAVKQEIQQIQWHKADASNAAKLSAKVEETHAFLTRLAVHDPKSLDLAGSHEQLHALKADLESLDKGAMDDFAANETHIKAHKLPGVIEQRQQEAVQTYRSRMDALMAELNAADAAKDAAGFMTHVAAAKAHLDKVQVKPFHEKFDPKNLPFSVAKPTNVKPRLTKKDYEARPVAPPKRAQVAANGPLTGILSAADVTGALPTNPGDPSYVAATDDVQITPAIQAQAKALNNDPVQIYNWVHNNVEYIPTYGSIQGSDMTLQTLKGNDFDQASLLIALLRAANIPARYVYGTIQVPIAQVENWVGGVTDPNAALNLMSQGGIPVTGLVQGGQIKYAQLEHVWVEAWVNYIPSLATRPGPGNTWIPMDASFKQYSYTQPVNILSALGFNPTPLIDQTLSSATFNINSNTQSVSNVDLIGMQTQVASSVSLVSEYAGTVGSQVTYASMAGSKQVAHRNANVLSATLAAHVIAVGNRFATLPSTFKLQFQYELEDANANSIFSYVASSTDLGGHELALSFTTASSADEQVLESYVPPPNQDGTPVALSQYPDSLPGYLIKVVPQLTLDGQIVAVGMSFPVGSQLQSQKGFGGIGAGWSLSTKPVTAGQYQAIALDLQGEPARYLSQLESNLNSVTNALNSGTGPEPSKHDLVGTILGLTGLSYFAVNDSMDEISAKYTGIVDYRLPSFGTFSTVIEPIYSFGIPRSVRMPGTLMDMDGLKSMTVASDNDRDTAVGFTIEAGSRLSTFENVIPNMLYSRVDPTSHGMSAMTAIVDALSQGQAIYLVNPSNISSSLPSLNVSSEVQARIQDVVNSGDSVTIPQSTVSANGWTGSGYVILDPATGDGAYEISGSANGNQQDTDNNSSTPIAMASIAEGGPAGSGGSSLFGELGEEFLEGIDRVKGAYDIDQNCSGSNLVVASAFFVFTGALMQTFKESIKSEAKALVLEGLLAPEAVLFIEIFIIIFVTLFMAALVDSMVDGCQGRPVLPPPPYGQ